MKFTQLLTCILFAIITAGAFAQQAKKPKEPWMDLEDTNRKDPRFLEKTVAHMDLVYAKNGEREMLLNLYHPKDQKTKLPAIVCLHGGGWAKGKRQHASHFAQALAARGFVAVSIDYRLSGEAAFPAQIEDAKAAVRWLRANAEQWKVDADAIGATGSSAGGHLAALLASSGDVVELEGKGGNPKFSSRIQAAAPMCAQTDLMVERIKEKSMAPKSIFRPFLGGSQEEAPKTYQLASPMHHFNAGDPPTFFLSGELDDPSTHAEAFRKQSKKLGIATGLLVIPEALHGFHRKQKFFDVAIDQLDLFLTKQLKK
jgi:arylsulfatase A